MKLSYHVHSQWSDGEGTVPEILKSAKKLGLDEIGISDHYTLSPDGKTFPWSMKLDALGAYVDDIQIHAKQEKISTRIGLEVDFFENSSPKLPSILSSYPFDYLIGSVHVVDGISIDQAIHYSQKEDLAKNYWRLIRQMAESNLFDIVGHLDVIKKFGFYTSNDLSKEIENALQAISKAEMTVELNTSGWFFPCREQYPTLNLLQRCKELKIPIMVNADAHSPKNLTRNFDTAYELLHEIGFSSQSCYKDRKRCLAPLPKGLTL